MKFLTWFLGIVLLLITPLLVVFFNFKQIIFSPESTKRILVQTDFYAQAKSVIKKSLFEANGDSAELQIISKATNKTLDEYDFQPKVEKVIDDFFLGLSKNDGSLVIVIDLNDIKTRLIQNGGQEIKGSANGADVAQIPDSWKVNLAKYSSSLRIAAFFYRNFVWIMLGYSILAVLFLLFSILLGVRYLKLFFTIILITGIIILLQRILIGFISIPEVFSSVTEQGRTGLQLVIENLAMYFKEETSKFLLWESLPMIGISIIGLIICGLAGQKNIHNIPLDDRKIT